MELKVGQALENAAGERVTVVGLLRGESPLVVVEHCRNCPRSTIDPEGWYFDPANPSAWRVVEKVPEPRTLDHILDDISELINPEEEERDADDRFDVLRAELKARVEYLIEDAVAWGERSRDRDSYPDGD